MTIHNNPDLMNTIIQEISNTAPRGWSKIVFYLEFLDDVKIGLRNKSTARCFGGEAFGIRLDAYDVGGSMKAFNAFKDLYHNAIQNGDRWTGVLVTIFGDGQFRLRFYYDETPLLDGDRAAVEEIISQGLRDLPAD